MSSPRGGIAPRRRNSAMICGPGGKNIPTPALLPGAEYDMMECVLFQQGRFYFMARKSSFPWKQFLKALAVIAVPVALQNLLTTTGSMVDTMMIAPLGENSVGAVGLCAQFTSLMIAGYWVFVGGGMLFFSQ